MLVFMCRDPDPGQAKFHVVSYLHSVLKIAILILASECPCTPLKISLPKNETTLNLKSASFVMILHLHKGLTHFQSQIKAIAAFYLEFHFKYFELTTF